MNYYAMDGLPLEKQGNKYVITNYEFYKWVEEMEEKRKEQLALIIIYIIVMLVFIILAFIFASKLY